MAQSDTASDNRSMLERHLQTGIQLLLVALLGWAGLELVALGKSTVALQERLTYQGEQITSLRRELRDWSELYYRQSDADREIGGLRAAVHDLETRVTNLENGS
ncbi:hypothetical protein [Halomonas koreensis]|uniref:Cell division protein FtsL n=1 Tax=Halomonas koreensis TaxID=245385 RepID=A0ABU1G6E0_9GAMM|nr:hypothetical protein [Halomonas koreensis]MDR5868088.1 hypothetical protein [Halomonas koreensis]